MFMIMLLIFTTISISIQWGAGVTETATMEAIRLSALCTCEVCLLTRTSVIVWEALCHLFLCFLTSLSQKALLRNTASPYLAAFQADLSLHPLIMLHSLMLCFHESVKFFAFGFLLHFGEQRFPGNPITISFLNFLSGIKLCCVEHLLQTIQEGCIPSGRDNKSKIEDSQLNLNFR